MYMYMYDVESKVSSTKLQSSKVGLPHSPKRTVTMEAKKDSKQRASPKPETPSNLTDSKSFSVEEDATGRDGKSRGKEMKEKRRKKVVIEEVSDGKNPEKDEEKDKGRNGEEKEQAAQERIKLQDVKPEKVHVHAVSILHVLYFVSTTSSG